ncbi:MAG: PIG-L deacetylase family protein [Caldilineaceae bacterium]
MFNLSPRVTLRDMLCRRMRAGGHALSQEALCANALVFAPHPDDETLGCGGTVIRKIRAGAAVHLVVMTDGRGSHTHLMAPETIRAIRAREVVAAGAALGLAATDITHLDFPDGDLDSARTTAVARVVELLDQYRPAEVFIPYYREAPTDHHVTNAVVRDALRHLQLAVTVYEYPIWYWQHWPWVRVPLRRKCNSKQLARASVAAGFGARTVQDFRCFVDISDVLDCKRRALAQHRSQTTRLVPDPSWAILGEVSDGEWLERFFQTYEVFYRYRWHGMHAVPVSDTGEEMSTP